MAEDRGNLNITVGFNDPIHIGEDIEVTLIRRKGMQFAVSVQAPRDIKVRRHKTYLEDQEGGNGRRVN